MKVAVLTHQSPAAEYFCRAIAERHDLIGVFVEKSTGSKVRKAFTQFRRNRKKYGLLTAVVRFFEIPFVVWLDATYARCQARFFPLSTIKEMPPWPVHHIRDVNDDRTVETLRDLQPDVVCVFGAGILRAPIIGVPRLGTLNMHTSQLPAYRGVKSELWALANGDFDRIGVTVHVLDEGIDTGPILAQRAVPVERGDDDRTLRCKNIVEGTTLVLETLDRLAEGRAVPVPQDATQKSYYSTPTLPAYLRMRRNIRKLKHR